MESDKRVPMKVMTEKEYLTSQTGLLGGILLGVGLFLSVIMGIAAILSATNTMLASIGSRTREVGILLSLGFPRLSIFLAFLFEASLIGLCGGLVGAVMVLPFNGLETGTMNGQTFTEVVLAFRVDAAVLFTGTIMATMMELSAVSCQLGQPRV